MKKLLISSIFQYPKSQFQTFSKVSHINHPTTMYDRYLKGMINVSSKSLILLSKKITEFKLDWSSSISSFFMSQSYHFLSTIQTHRT